MKTLRFHLPSWCNALYHIRRRCGTAMTEVARYPVAARDDGDAPAYVRVRAEHTLDRRHRQNYQAKIRLEIDLDASATHPARRVDVDLPTNARGLQQWLAMLGKDHAGDECIVGYGDWGDARLQFEDRGGGKYLLDVRAPDDWTIPAEMADAIDVSADSEWSRPLLTKHSWPAKAFAPIEPQPATAWGAPLEPATDPEK